MLSRCDNMAVVAVMRSRYASDRRLMHLLRVLFFLEARYNFYILAQHIPGKHNSHADNISRNRHHAGVPHRMPWYVKATNTNSLLFYPPSFPAGRLDFLYLADDVQELYELGIAPSTNKTYAAAIKKFQSFCTTFNIQNPFPLSGRMAVTAILRLDYQSHQLS